MTRPVPSPRWGAHGLGLKPGRREVQECLGDSQWHLLIQWEVLFRATVEMVVTNMKHEEEAGCRGQLDGKQSPSVSMGHWFHGPTDRCSSP